MADHLPLGGYGPRRAEDHPPVSAFPGYRSTVRRSPIHAPIRIPQSMTELTGPGPVVALGATEDADLTTNAGTGGEAIGARTIVAGRLLEQGEGRPLPGSTIEIWQANAAGRYAHRRETDFPAPLDPNFTGVGSCTTDGDGCYRFTTVRPGPYPWGNHPNAWRPSHIHLSVLGPSLGSRLVTQMYFPDDPLLDLDPIFNSVPEHARHRLVARYDHDLTQPGWALGYRFDIVVRGLVATPFEDQA